MILIDSVYRTGKNYYPRLYLKERKYDVKEKKMPEYWRYFFRWFWLRKEKPDKEKFIEENSNEQS